MSNILQEFIRDLRQRGSKDAYTLFYHKVKSGEVSAAEFREVMEWIQPDL